MDGFGTLLDVVSLRVCLVLRGMILLLLLLLLLLLMLERRRDKLGGDGLVERLERSGGLFQQRLELCGVCHMCTPPELGLDLVADGCRRVGVVWKHRRRCCAEKSPIQGQRLGARVHSFKPKKLSGLPTLPRSSSVIRVITLHLSIAHPMMMAMA